jgi:hypothetical protein
LSKLGRVRGGQVQEDDVVERDRALVDQLDGDGLLARDGWQSVTARCLDATVAVRKGQQRTLVEHEAAGRAGLRLAATVKKADDSAAPRIRFLLRRGQKLTRILALIAFRSDCSGYLLC